MTILMLKDKRTNEIFYDKVEIHEIMVELSWDYNLFDKLLKQDNLIDGNNCCDALLNPNFKNEYYKKHKKDIMQELENVINYRYEIIKNSITDFITL